MARKSSSSLNPKKEKHTCSLESLRCYSKNNSGTDSSITTSPSPRSSSSVESSYATSWTTHDVKGLRNGSTYTETTFGARSASLGTADHPEDVDILFVHIGAQFYGVTIGRWQNVQTQLDWNVDGRRQVRGHPSAFGLTPMDRFREEHSQDGTYTYMSQDGRVYGTGAAVKACNDQMKLSEEERA